MTRPRARAGPDPTPPRRRDALGHGGPCSPFDGDATPGAWGELLAGPAGHAGREAARARSAAIFGSRHFAEVAVAAGRLSGTQGAGVTVRMVAAQTGLCDGVARHTMGRFRDAGLLAVIPRALGEARGPVRYRVLRTPLWDGVLSACAALDGQADRG